MILKSLASLEGVERSYAILVQPSVSKGFGKPVL